MLEELKGMATLDNDLEKAFKGLEAAIIISGRVKTTFMMVLSFWKGVQAHCKSSRWVCAGDCLCRASSACGAGGCPHVRRAFGFTVCVCAGGCLFDVPSAAVCIWVLGAVLVFDVPSASVYWGYVL